MGQACVCPTGRRNRVHTAGPHNSPGHMASNGESSGISVRQSTAIDKSDSRVKADKKIASKADGGGGILNPASIPKEDDSMAEVSIISSEERHARSHAPQQETSFSGNAEKDSLTAVRRRICIKPIEPDANSPEAAANQDICHFIGINQITADSDARYAEVELATDRQYTPGDYIFIRPKNPPADIIRLTRLLRLDERDLDQAFTLMVVTETEDGNLVDEESVTRFRFRLPSTLRHVFAEELDLHGPPTVRLLKAIDIEAELPAHLQRFVSSRAGYERWVAENQPTLLSLLEALHDNLPTLECVLMCAPLVQPRCFLASSAAEGKFTFCLERHSQQAKYRPGMCARFLGSRVPGEEIAATITKGQSLLCPLPTNKPIILVGGYHGVGPFKGYLDAAKGGKATNRIYLLYEFRKSHEAPYFAAIASFEESGFIEDMLLAPSIDEPAGPEGSALVRRLDESEKWKRLLGKVVKLQDGEIYVCGSEPFCELVQNFLKLLFERDVRHQSWYHEERLNPLLTHVTTSNVNAPEEDVLVASGEYFCADKQYAILASPTPSFSTPDSSGHYHHDLVETAEPVTDPALRPTPRQSLLTGQQGSYHGDRDQLLQSSSAPKPPTPPTTLVLFHDDDLHVPLTEYPGGIKYNIGIARPHDSSAMPVRPESVTKCPLCPVPHVIDENCPKCKEEYIDGALTTRVSQHGHKPPSPKITPQAIPQVCTTNLGLIELPDDHTHVHFAGEPSSHPAAVRQCPVCPVPHVIDKNCRLCQQEYLATPSETPIQCPFCPVPMIIDKNCNACQEDYLTPKTSKRAMQAPPLEALTLKNRTGRGLIEYPPESPKPLVMKCHVCPLPHEIDRSCQLCQEEYLGGAVNAKHIQCRVCPIPVEIDRECAVCQDEFVLPPPPIPQRPPPLEIIEVQNLRNSTNFGLTEHLPGAERLPPPEVTKRCPICPIPHLIDRNCHLCQEEYLGRPPEGKRVQCRVCPIPIEVDKNCNVCLEEFILPMDDHKVIDVRSVEPIPVGLLRNSTNFGLTEYPDDYVAHVISPTPVKTPKICAICPIPHQAKSNCALCQLESLEGSKDDRIQCPLCLVDQADTHPKARQAEYVQALPVFSPEPEVRTLRNSTNSGLFEYPDEPYHPIKYPKKRSTEVTVYCPVCPVPHVVDPNCEICQQEFSDVLPAEKRHVQCNVCSVPVALDDNCGICQAEYLLDPAFKAQEQQSNEVPPLETCTLVNKTNRGLVEYPEIRTLRNKTDRGLSELPEADFVARELAAVRPCPICPVPHVVDENCQICRAEFEDFEPGPPEQRVQCHACPAPLEEEIKHHVVANEFPPRGYQMEPPASFVEAPLFLGVLRNHEGAGLYEYPPTEVQPQITVTDDDQYRLQQGVAFGEHEPQREYTQVAVCPVCPVPVVVDDTCTLCQEQYVPATSKADLLSSETHMGLCELPVAEPRIPEPEEEHRQVVECPVCPVPVVVDDTCRLCMVDYPVQHMTSYATTVPASPSNVVEVRTLKNRTNRGLFEYPETDQPFPPTQPGVVECPICPVPIVVDDSCNLCMVEQHHPEPQPTTLAEPLTSWPLTSETNRGLQEYSLEQEVLHDVVARHPEEVQYHETPVALTTQAVPAAVQENFHAPLLESQLRALQASPGILRNSTNSGLFEYEPSGGWQSITPNYVPVPRQGEVYGKGPQPAQAYYQHPAQYTTEDNLSQYSLTDEGQTRTSVAFYSNHIDAYSDALAQQAIASAKAETILARAEPAFATADDEQFVRAEPIFAVAQGFAYRTIEEPELLRLEGQTGFYELPPADTSAIAAAHKETPPPLPRSPPPPALGDAINEGPLLTRKPSPRMRQTQQQIADDSSLPRRSSFGYQMRMSPVPARSPGSVPAGSETDSTMYPSRQRSRSEKIPGEGIFHATPIVIRDHTTRQSYEDKYPGGIKRYALPYNQRALSMPDYADSDRSWPPANEIDQLYSDDESSSPQRQSGRIAAAAPHFHDPSLEPETLRYETEHKLYKMHDDDNRPKQPPDYPIARDASFVGGQVNWPPPAAEIYRAVPVEIHAVDPTHPQVMHLKKEDDGNLFKFPDEATSSGRQPAEEKHPYDSWKPLYTVQAEELRKPSKEEATALALLLAFAEPSILKHEEGKGLCELEATPLHGVPPVQGQPMYATVSEVTRPYSHRQVDEYPPRPSVTLYRDEPAPMVTPQRQEQDHQQQGLAAEPIGAAGHLHRTYGFPTEVPSHVEPTVLRPLNDRNLYKFAEQDAPALPPRPTTRPPSTFVGAAFENSDGRTSPIPVQGVREKINVFEHIAQAGPTSPAGQYENVAPSLHRRSSVGALILRATPQLAGTLPRAEPRVSQQDEAGQTDASLMPIAVTAATKTPSTSVGTVTDPQPQIQQLPSPVPYFYSHHHQAPQMPTITRDKGVQADESTSPAPSPRPRDEVIDGHRELTRQTPALITAPGDIDLLSLERDGLIEPDTFPPDYAGRRKQSALSPDQKRRVSFSDMLPDKRLTEAIHVSVPDPYVEREQQRQRMHSPEPYLISPLSPDGAVQATIVDQAYQDDHEEYPFDSDQSPTYGQNGVGRLVKFYERGPGTSSVSPASSSLSPAKPFSPYSDTSSPDSGLDTITAQQLRDDLGETPLARRHLAALRHQQRSLESPEPQQMQPGRGSHSPRDFDVEFNVILNPDLRKRHYYEQQAEVAKVEVKSPHAGRRPYLRGSFSDSDSKTYSVPNGAHPEFDVFFNVYPGPGHVRRYLPNQRRFVQDPVEILVKSPPPYRRLKPAVHLEEEDNTIV